MGSIGRKQKCGLYFQPLHFHFYILTVTKFSSIGYSIFIHFLCIQERQRAPSPPISPIRRDGDVAATPISGGDVSIFKASQQA
jgi:hypothetical protein